MYKDAIQDIWFLNKKPESFYDEILPHFETLKFKEWQVIYNQNQFSHSVYFILKGRVLNMTTLRIFPQGSMFGEMDAFLRRERTEKMVAANDIVLIWIDSKKFVHIVESMYEKFPFIEWDIKYIIWIWD